MVIVKQKLMHVLIMVLAVAAVVGGVALFSDWVAPGEGKQPAAVVTGSVQDTVNEETTAAPAEDGNAADANIPSEESGEAVSVQEGSTASAAGGLAALNIPVLPQAQEAVAETAEATLLGRWQMTQECVNEFIGFGDAVCMLEFTEDGQCIQTVTLMGYTQTETAAYTWENDVLTVNDETAEYVLNGDSLVITGDVTLTYFRVK